MKAQSSIEFVAFALVVLIFMMFFFTLTFSKKADAEDLERQNLLSLLCGDIASKIDRAYSFGPGFSQEAALPAKISGASYKVTVFNQSIFCESGKHNSISEFSSSNVKNSTSSTPFVLQIKTIKIENVGGAVLIS